MQARQLLLLANDKCIFFAHDNQGKDVEGIVVEDQNGSDEANAMTLDDAVKGGGGVVAQPDKHEVKADSRKFDQLRGNPLPSRKPLGPRKRLRRYDYGTTVDKVIPPGRMSFLHLPCEIRFEIYEYYLEQDNSSASNLRVGFKMYRVEKHHEEMN